MIDVRTYTLKEGEGRKKSFAWDLILSASANPGTIATKPNYSLKTEREVDRKEWMSHLQKVIDGDKEEGPKPSPPPTLSSLVGSGQIKAKGGKKGNIISATIGNNNLKLLFSIVQIEKWEMERLFGRPLELAVHNPDGSQIPAIVVKCVTYISSERGKVWPNTPLVHYL